MGNTICTEAEPSSLRSITQHAASCTWCQATTTSSSATHVSPTSGRRNAEDELLSNTVLEQVYRGVYHNVRVFRLSLKGPHAASSTSPVSGPHRGTTTTRRVNVSRVRRTFAAEAHLLSRSNTSSRASLARASQRLSSGGALREPPNVNPLQGSPRETPLLANIACDPVVLATNDEVCASDTDVFLVLHVERVPLHPLASTLTWGALVRECNETATPQSPGMGEDTTGCAALTSRSGNIDELLETCMTSPRGGVRVAPRWAQEMHAVFTPRGLTTVLAGNVDKPMANQSINAAATTTATAARTTTSPVSARGEACEFVYSIHLLNGKQAHPLLAAGAVLHALQLERVLKEQPSLLRCLFYNCRGSSGSTYTSNANTSAGGYVGSQSHRAHSATPGTAGLARPPASSGRGGRPSMPFRRPATIRAALRMTSDATMQATREACDASVAPYTTTSSSKYDIHGGVPNAVPLHEAITHNAVLRVLLRNAFAQPTMASGASPRSADYSVTSISNTPRCSLSSGSPRNPTPRPLATSGGNFASAFLPKTASAASPQYGAVHSATPSLSLAPQLQGPPPLEIPRLRFSGLAASSIAAQRVATTSEAAPATPSLLTTMTAHSNGAESTRTTTTTTNAGAGGAEPAVPHSPTTSASPLTSAHARTTSVSRPTILLAQTRRETTNTTTTMSSPPPVIDDFTNTTTTTTTITETTTNEGTTHTPSPLQPQQSGEEEEDEKAHSEDWDELAMTEERAQRLKLAAPEVTEVLPWLYVGGEAAAKDRAQLLAKGITAIVNTVAFDLPNYHEDLFHYLDLFICDSPDEPIFCVFPIVNAFIERTRLAGGRTFVHCHQGVSRSCALVIAYVMWKEGMCYDEAYAAVRRCRNVCSPNTGFYVHLHLWERHLTTPVRSRAYAYVPYSATYAFPFAFRLALTFSALQNNADETHTSDQNNNNAGEDKEEDDDEGAHLFNPAVQRVTTRQCDCSLDPRLTYGFLLPNATTNSSKATLQEEEDDETQPGSVGVDQPTLTNFLWHGDACPSLVASQAELAWRAFLRYNFYHGPPHESRNDRGERVYFAPATDLHVESEPQVVFSTYAVESQINHWFASSSSSSTSAGTQTTAPHCSMRCGPDAHWDALLLASADLASQLTAHVAEETRRSQWSPQRKRAREEEQRRLPVLQPLASRPAKAKQAHDALHHTDNDEEDNNVIEQNEEKTASSDTPHTSSSSSSSTTSAEGYLSATSSRSLHADMNNTTVAPQAQHGDESEQCAGNEYAPDEQVDAAGRKSQHSTSEQASTHEVIEGERVVVTNLASDNAIVAPQDTSCDMEDVAAAQDQEDRQLIAPNATMPFVQADDATPAVGTSALDFEVYVYPFTHNDMVEVIGMADLSPETCYAILLPATAFGHVTNSDTNNGDAGNQIYLWIGEDSPHDATTAMKAFERNLAIKPHRSASARASRRRRLAGRRTSDSAVAEAYSVKLSNGSLLKNATVSVVYEGEEPDDLLLVLD